jgi:hypothetical protein
MIKRLLFLSLVTLIITSESHFSSEELVEKFKQANTEERPGWKLVYLRQALSEWEQIEALERALEKQVTTSRDSDLESKLRNSKKLVSGERIATLSNLLPSPRKQIDAFTTKLAEKIKELESEKADLSVELLSD